MTRNFIRLLFFNWISLQLQTDTAETVKGSEFWQSQKKTSKFVRQAAEKQMKKKLDMVGFVTVS
jgi:hypothetical protein